MYSKPRISRAAVYNVVAVLVKKKNGMNVLLLLYRLGMST